MDATESKLAADLATLGDRLADEQFCTELYRALAGGHLTKDGDAIAPSWAESEDIVNRLREQQDLGTPLALARSGGEGELSGDARRALDSLGWRVRERDTGTHDPDHVGRPAGAPPADAGERQAPVGDSHAWERQAHEEAEAGRFSRGDAPAQAGPGSGAGGGEAPRVGGG
jgi:hypothetical protein